MGILAVLDFVFIPFMFILSMMMFFVLLLTVVCEWMGGILFVDVCHFRDVWCYCCELRECLNVASPVGCVLPLCYLFEFQMYQCVFEPEFDSKACVFVRSRASQAVVTAGSPKNGIGPTSMGAVSFFHTICADICSSPTTSRMCYFGPQSQSSVSLSHTLSPPPLFPSLSRFLFFSLSPH